MKRILTISLLLPIILASCKSQRTVYDQYGRVVEESQPGVEKDIYSVMEARFDAAFSEKRNKDGVPETASSMVSRYQSDIDNARSSGKRFTTKSFAGVSESGLQGKSFAGSGRSFAGVKTYAGSRTSSYRRDLSPDFLNENRGLAHRDYLGAHTDRRSGWESQGSDAAERHFITRSSRYASRERSGYVQSREALREQPVIRDHSNPSGRSIDDTRRLMGRDESSL